MKNFSLTALCIMGSLFVSAFFNAPVVFANSCSCVAGTISSVKAKAAITIEDAKNLCTKYKGSSTADYECLNATIEFAAPATDSECKKNEDPDTIKATLGIPSLAKSFVTVDKIVCSFTSSPSQPAPVTPSTPTPPPSGSAPAPITPQGGSGTAPAAPKNSGAPVAYPTKSSGGLIPEPTGKCPENYRDGTPANLSVPCIDGERDFALDDIKSLLATIGNFMLGVSGAIVLFCFVLGGFFWLASAGNQKMVDRGKSLISGAVIGLIIMFSAYTFVVFAVRTLVGSDAYSPSATGPGAAGANGPSSTIIKGKITKIPFAVLKTGLCEKISDGSSCQKVGSCKTAYAITDACGTDAVSDGTQECCVLVKQASQNTACGKLGGTCQASSKPCAGPIVSGFCSGGGNTQCCFDLK